MSSPIPSPDGAHALWASFLSTNSSTEDLGFFDGLDPRAYQLLDPLNDVPVGTGNETEFRSAAVSPTAVPGLPSPGPEPSHAGSIPTRPRGTNRVAPYSTPGAGTQDPVAQPEHVTELSARDQAILRTYDTVRTPSGERLSTREVAQQVTADGHQVGQTTVSHVLKQHGRTGGGVGSGVSGKGGGSGALVRADPTQMADAAARLGAVVSAGQSNLAEVQHVSATMSRHWAGSGQQAFTTMARQATGALRSSLANMETVSAQVDRVGQGYVDTDTRFAQALTNLR